MKSFTYQSCNNEAVLSVKKEFKQNPNDSSIKSKYESLIGDTYIAIENIEEALNDLNELQKLKALIDNEDTSFANVILGTSNRGNNDSCYRAYLTIDGKSIIEVRIANHYETKTSALEQSNNLSQFLYQVVLITDPPQPQQGDSITTTTTAANLKILTKGIISRNTSVEKLSRLLKSIHDYLISPNSEWEEAKPKKTIKPENKQYNNMNKNKKLIRLTESDLHQIVKESVETILETYEKGESYSFNGDGVKDCEFLTSPWDGYTVGLVNHNKKTVSAMHGYCYPNGSSKSLMKYALKLGYEYVDPYMPKKLNKTIKQPSIQP